MFKRVFEGSWAGSSPFRRAPPTLRTSYERLCSFTWVVGRIPLGTSSEQIDSLVSSKVLKGRNLYRVRVELKNGRYWDEFRKLRNLSESRKEVVRVIEDTKSKL
jgi:hypothetical protein